MGKLDTESKEYVNKRYIFADAFNYLIYDGEQVIDPEKLFPVDTTEITVPYGNGARVPIQKYRDSLKMWAAMSDNETIYVLLGGEIQNRVHYAMPVKDMLYDSVNYAAQVSEASISYRKKKEEGEIVFGEEDVKIKLSSEEFLSGFRKEDKLIPVVTAVIYFGSGEWDGPRTLHEMIRFPDERVKKVVPNYEINLLIPENMEDSDFNNKFHTGLGLTFNVIKHQKDTEVVDILKATKHKQIDRASAVFIRDVLNCDLTFSEPEQEGEVVDVCKGLEDYILKEKVLAIIDYLKDEGKSNEEIVEKIIKKYPVSEQYVWDLLLVVA